MYKKAKVLQIGLESWSELLSDEENRRMTWSFLDLNLASEEMCQNLVRSMKKRAFDVVFCTDRLENSVLESLMPLIEAHALVIDQAFKELLDAQIEQMKLPVFVDCHNQMETLDILNRYFFSGQAGSKLPVNNIAVSDTFDGDITLMGEHRLILQGDFSNFSPRHPVLTWQHNMIFYEHSRKVWLEYEKSEGIHLTLIIHGVRSGTSEVMKTWVFSEEEFKKGLDFRLEDGIGYLSASLSVQGEGEIKIGPLHYRESRSIYGEFLLGGDKVSDEQNEEIFYYFNPGDLKPPLNVYFSGYQGREGFEGFYAMKGLNAPFLLITDARLEGGSFYLGSETLEKKVAEIILLHLQQLGFSRQELILSGLSMGTFGALYYGSKLQPHSIIVGKPLVNLGTMAEKERIIRPGGFPTSLDLLQSLTGRQDKEGVAQLNSRFWQVFDEADFENTQFVIAYMQHDDYDDTAYRDILEHLLRKNTRVIGKGIPGRHNDNSSAIFQWFINHYQRILVDSFHRGGEV